MKHVAVGDILVFADGKSTADLSHGVLTRMLHSNGAGGKGRTLIFLPGRYRPNLIDADWGTLALPPPQILLPSPKRMHWCIRLLYYHHRKIHVIINH